MFEQDIMQGPGTGSFQDHTLEILLMLFGAFALGLWLGWILWNRYKREYEALRANSLHSAMTDEALKIELNTAKGKVAALESDKNSLAAQVEALTAEKIKASERISGLETALEDELSRNRKLSTELNLSMPDKDASVNIPLDIELPANPEPVPAVVPVELPADEPEEPVVEPVKAEEEEKTEPVVAETVLAPIALEVVSPVSEPEAPAVPKSKGKAGAKTPEQVMVASDQRDDLTVIEGIGPKINMLLNQYNIYTYRQLAETSVDRLREILSTAGPQLAMHDPGTWPSQANLAANDQWDALKSIQGFLKGGKKPT